jgi:threonine dehydrogenase-like Zn-dependent dehydrogenase
MAKIEALPKIPANAMVYSLVAPKSLVLNERELDTSLAGSRSVLAQTVFSAISTGTELAAWAGKPPLRPSKVYPRLMGYCNVAQVQATGDGVEGLEPGDYILTHQSHCSSFCCDGNDILLSFKNLSRANQKRLATTYLYHLGYLALLEGGYRPGFEVAIVGLGALGFATASLVSAYGGVPKIYSGRSNADHIMRHVPYVQCFSKSDVWDVRQSVAGLDGADLVINTSDSWSDYELSLKTVRRGGTVALLGFPGRGMSAPDFNPLDSKYLYDKAISVRQISHVSELDIQPIDLRFTLKRNLAHLYSLLESERLDSLPLLSMEYHWDQLDKAYRMLETRAEGCLSAILDWSC